MAEAIRHVLNRRAGLNLFLDDGRTEIDLSTVDPQSGLRLQVTGTRACAARTA